MTIKPSFRLLQALVFTSLISSNTFSQNLVKKEMEIVPGDYYTVAFSPDSKYVIGSSFSTVQYSEALTLRVGGTQVFNIETGVKEMAKTDRPSLSAVFRADGKEILSAELSNGLQTFTFKDGVEKPIKAPNEEITFSTLYTEDGLNAILGTVQGNVHIIEIASGKLKKTIKVNDSTKIVISLHLINGGKTLITHSAGQIQFWDLATGNLNKTLKSEDGNEIGYIAVSGDKKTMVSQCEKTVSVWDLETIAVKTTFQTGWKYCGSVSPDGSLIALGFNGGFYTFNAKGEVIRGWGGDGVNIKTLSFSPDGKLCAAGLAAGELIIFDAAILATKAE